MNFDVADPFKLTRYGTKKLITDQSLTELKAQLEVGILAFPRRADATSSQYTLPKGTRHITSVRLAKARSRVRP
jgi:hypothetical protein